MASAWFVVQVSAILWMLGRKAKVMAAGSESTEYWQIALDSVMQVISHPGRNHAGCLPEVFLFEHARQEWQYFQFMSAPSPPAPWQPAVGAPAMP